MPVLELAGEPCILLARHRAPAFYDHIAGLCRTGGFTLEAKQDVEHPQTLIALVAAGLGISLVPSAFASLPRRGVVYRRLDPPGPALQTIVAWRRDDSTPLVREFLAVVREVRRGRRPRA